jgi:uncharacterized paraquat-inducible protein A
MSLDLDENWDDEDDPNEEDEATIPCPYCGEEIHEDAQQCPACGQYISAEDAPPASKPWWILIAAILGLVGIYLAVMR